MRANFQAKQVALTFSTQICPKMDFRGGILKSKSGFGIWTSMCANFQLKRTTLSFLAQICPKTNLKLETLKINVGIRISTLEIPCVPIFRENGQPWVFGPKFAQKWKFQKSKSGFGSSILKTLCAPIFSKQLWIFGPKFVQKLTSGVKISKI